MNYEDLQKVRGLSERHTPRGMVELKQIEDRIDPPSLRFYRQMQRVLAQNRGPYANMQNQIRELEELFAKSRVRITDSIQQAMRDYESYRSKTNREMLGFSETLQKYQSPYRNLLNDFERVVRSSAMRRVSVVEGMRFSEHVLASLLVQRDNGSLHFLKGPYEDDVAGSVFQQLNVITGLIDETEIEAATDQILTVLRTAEPHMNTQVTRSELLGFIGIIVTILLYLLARHDAQVQDAHTQERSDRAFGQQEVLITSVNKMVDLQSEFLDRFEEGDQITAYVIQRTTTLRNRPNRQSKVLSEVHYNQVVTVVSQHRKWVQIEFFDNVSGQAQIGWIMKKYAKKMAEPMDR